MSSRSRREFLITTGTGVAAGLLSSTASHAQPPAATTYPLRTRRNVVSAAARGDVTSLAKGVDEMRKLATAKPSDPRGWVLQAFIHGDCNQFTKCQHGNWFFPPWHRSFIYYFEQLIQHFSGDANFALPYWDWSRSHGVPASFYGAANPLNDLLSIRSKCGSSAPTAGRGRTVTDQFSQSDLNTFVGTAVINRIQQNPDYATYGGGNPGTGELEGTPHNFIHRWVGGAKFSNMVQTFSPLDPIFWMHHCNIDRLYSNWLTRPNHFPPPDSAWRGTSFNDFFDKDGNPVGSQFTCGQTVDSKVMGYVYDDTMEMPQTLTQATRSSTPKVQIVGSVSAAKATKQQGVLAFVSEAAPAAEARRFMNAAALGVSDYNARLQIEGVKPPARQNTAVHVFLGPGITATTPVSAPGYVGTFTFFNGEGTAADHHPGARNVLLNASEALQRLYGDSSLPEGANLTVSLITRPLYTGVTAFATLEEIQPARVQLDIVSLSS